MIECNYTGSGVYSIQNVINGNEYIGSSANIHKRMREHRNQLYTNSHHSKILQRAAYNKYGETNFIVIILEEVSREQLVNVEQVWLDCRNPKYNVAKFSNSGMRGRTHSAETREIIRKKLHEKFTDEEMKARSRFASSFSTSPEAKEKHSMSLRRVLETPEHKKKQSKVQKELWSRPEHRNKMVLAHLNYTPEIRKKLSEAQKKVWRENKDRLSIARRGKGSSILNAELVREIRRKYRDGYGSCAVLGREYGVDRRTIYGVISRKTWDWVTDED